LGVTAFTDIPGMLIFAGIFNASMLKCAKDQAGKDIDIHMVLFPEFI
jgi:hypothetical protein